VNDLLPSSLLLVYRTNLHPDKPSQAIAQEIRARKTPENPSTEPRNQSI